MRKIVITGATSMLGTALTEVAVREGTEVYAIVRPDTKRSDRIINSPLVHVVHSTIENLQNTEGISNDCDVLYHFAWVGTGKADRENAYIQERNIKYTLDAVELAEKCGCNRFVFVGSQAEYGRVDGVIDYKTVFSPLIGYGVAKLGAGKLSEKLCNQKGIDHVWGRVFSVYGTHDSPETVINYALDCWDQGKAAKFSAGTHMWNFLFESDSGEIFFRLGESYVPSGVYLIASNVSRPLREYIDIMMRVYGSTAKSEFDSNNTNKPIELNVNAGKTFETLNYTPQVDFEDGIRQIIKARK